MGKWIPYLNMLYKHSLSKIWVHVYNSLGTESFIELYNLLLYFIYFNTLYYLCRLQLLALPTEFQGAVPMAMSA